MPDITKLPKWAQEHIALRDRKIKKLQAELDELRSNHPGSNVALSNGIYDDTTLPNNSHIRFYVEPPKEAVPNKYTMRSAIDVYHQDSAYGPELYVASDGGRLMVLPSASNSARLRVDRR